jgi:hypothetical protein
MIVLRSGIMKVEVNRMTTLRHRFAIYIPSKDRDGNLIENRKRGNAVEAAIRFFSSALGGATVIDGTGAYVMDNEVAIEQISIVYGFGEDWKFLVDLLEYANVVAINLNQESVAIEADSKMILVD